MKKYLSIFLLFGFSYTQNNNFIYLKLGSGTTDNDITNIEFSSDPQPDIQSEGVTEGYAEIGFKGSLSNNSRYRLYVGSYAGEDTDGLGAEYGISSYGSGLELDIPDLPNLYAIADLFYNLEFIDYSDMRVGSGGDVYTYRQDGISMAFGLGYKINTNISMEIKYKTHNKVHFSEFLSGTLFIWGYDYSRSGIYTLINLQLGV